MDPPWTFYRGRRAGAPHPALRLSCHSVSLATTCGGNLRRNHPFLFCLYVFPLLSHGPKSKTGVSANQSAFARKHRRLAPQQIKAENPLVGFSAFTCYFAFRYASTISAKRLAASAARLTYISSLMSSYTRLPSMAESLPISNIKVPS